MGRQRVLGWRARLAILALCLGQMAVAEPAAQLDTATGAVVVTGLPSGDLNEVAAAGDRVRLQLSDAPERPGMLVRVTAVGDQLQIHPRFPLVAGNAYDLSIGLREGSFDVALRIPPVGADVPRVVGLLPGGGALPANALRVYIAFSQPMARGQVRDSIRLETAAGTVVPQPFLALETELWDARQERLTVVFDPGRVKQGVGPNLSLGAPLQAGESYRLVVAETMESAAGVPLGEAHVFEVSVGPAERRAVDPAVWQVSPLRAGTRDPLIVVFDRPMDPAALAYTLALTDRSDRAISGQRETDGRRWSFTPDAPWDDGPHHLMVHPELEDVAGNTLGAPFDAAGAMVRDTRPVSLLIQPN